MFSIKISSPTCEDLGIPRDYDDTACVPLYQTSARIIKNPALHFDGLRYEASMKGVAQKRDPFSPLCIIPLPSYTGDHGEQSCIGKRNERERERVRCVNDGYARLREHLPLERKDKRISKVDTLRKAIDYIRHLENILQQSDNIKTEKYDPDSPETDSRFSRDLCESFSDTDSDCTNISDSCHRKRHIERNTDIQTPCTEKRKCVHNA